MPTCDRNAALDMDPPARHCTDVDDDQEDVAHEASAVTAVAVRSKSPPKLRPDT